MAKARWSTILIALFSLFLLMGNTAPVGCGGGLNNRAGEPAIDVGGMGGADWLMRYGDLLEVRIKNAAGVVATHTVSLSAGGTFEAAGVTVDIAALCARPEVACPGEVFPETVRMTQPGSEGHLLYVTYNHAGPFQDLQQTTLVGNVDSDQDFSVALGIGAAGAGTCGLLGVSYATGHFETQGTEPPIGIDLEGTIVTAYSGGCILTGPQGAAAAGLTVELRLPFSANRL
jgi:hypothetical protein